MLMLAYMKDGYEQFHNIYIKPKYFQSLSFEALKYKWDLLLKE